MQGDDSTDLLDLSIEVSDGRYLLPNLRLVDKDSKRFLSDFNKSELLEILSTCSSITSMTLVEVNKRVG